jgi:hypothetical protein
MRLSLLRLVRFALLFAVTPAAFATTWYVNGVSGSDGNNCLSLTTACQTIGHAISKAASGDTVMVAAATYREHLTIALSLKIIGAGSSTTILDGGYLFPIPVATISRGASVVLSRVRIQHGEAIGGGGILNYGILSISQCTVANNLVLSQSKYPSVGGGIDNLGTLTISNTTISANGAIANTSWGEGGGISNADGALTINNSTINGNSASGSVYNPPGLGGGIFNNGGTLVINNSTVSGNRASSSTRYPQGRGGGIYNAGTLVVSNSTISANSAPLAGGVFNSSGWTAAFQNSIMANGFTSRNCYGTMTSHGYNLSSDDTCNFTNTGDVNNTNPMLGPLQYNGGPTQTMALPSGSPAIDAGNPSGCTDSQGHLLKTDQRGKPRPNTEDTSGCDMGAYERQSD